MTTPLTTPRTMAELAEIIGCSRRTLERWVSYDMAPLPSTLPSTPPTQRQTTLEQLGLWLVKHHTFADGLKKESARVYLRRLATAVKQLERAGDDE